ncbi:hypothetical protein EV363DRAFT_1349423 [Boletus edulis]|nr:hypothetical protein EV363DRAFT_1349423 [Boletus edulis]
MHPALYVEEILLEIFGHCYDCARYHMYFNETDLPSLARTCKTFSDPVLDILWTELHSVAPLIRCLPGAFSQIVDKDTLYSLNRPLEQADSMGHHLEISRRVWIFRLSHLFGVVSECVEDLSKPPTSTVSIFPNLCNVWITDLSGDTFPFLRHLCTWDAIEIFREGCPNMTTFDYDWVELDNDAISSLICQWSKLRSVDSLTHLSNMPHLRHLTVELCNALVDHLQSTWFSLLTFLTLIQYHPRAQSWATVSRFFDHLRLPAVEQVGVELACRPTEQEFKSFLATLPGTCNHQSLINISIDAFEKIAPSMPVPDPQYINFHHLYPLTVFVNIRSICIKIPRSVDLSEQELLQLAHSWPHLEKFDVGWHHAETRGLSAITSGGFVQLLGQCKSLSHFKFPFNTHGYTKVHQGHPWHGLKMLDGAEIYVGVSPIEEDSIEPLGIFFHVARFPHFNLYDGWDDFQPLRFVEHPDVRVRSLARKHWMERDNLLSSLRNRGQNHA